MTRALLTRQPRKPAPLFSDPFFRGLERFFNDEILPARWVSGNEGLGESRWIPAIDVRETEDSFEFTAELPGLTKDQVEITIEDKVLTLSGERKFEENEESNGYHRIERAYGSFSRSFTLPNEVDQDKVKAVFENGLLSVSIPKAEQVKPRKIQIG